MKWLHQLANDIWRIMLKCRANHRRYQRSFLRLKEAGVLLARHTAVNRPLKRKWQRGERKSAGVVFWWRFQQQPFHFHGQSSIIRSVHETALSIKLIALRFPFQFHCFHRFLWHDSFRINNIQLNLPWLKPDLPLIAQKWMEIGNRAQLVGNLPCELRPSDTVMVTHCCI